MSHKLSYIFRLFSILLFLLPGTNVSAEILTSADSINLRKYFNHIETVYQVGNPMQTSEVTKDLMTQDFAQQLQIILEHQYSKYDYGPYSPGFYYPMVGLALTAGDFSHVRLIDQSAEPPISGSFGRFFSVAIHFSKYHFSEGRLRLRSAIESGLSYSTRPYNSRTNPYSSIGGNVQQYFSYGLYIGYRIKDFELAIGPQFTHYSNSGVYQPNRGVNNIALSVRMKHDAMKEIPKCERSEENTFKPYIYHNFSIDYGIHTFKEDSRRSDIAPNKYNVYSNVNLSYELLLRVNPRHAVGLALDGFYTGNIERQKDFYRVYMPDAETHIHAFYTGLAFRQEMFVKDFAINIHFGYYLNDKHLCGINSYTRIYERIGMKYYISKFSDSKFCPYVGYYIKGNMLNAENYELCFGIRLKKA